MNTYKNDQTFENTTENLCQKFDYESEKIEENLNQIQENVSFLVQAINQNERSLILNYLDQIYKFKDFFKYSACIFNGELFYYIFSNCIASDSQEIIIYALKVLNNLLCTKVAEFTDIIFSSDLPQLIINFFSSSNIHIKSRSLSTICILSQLDPERSLAFWDPMLSSVSNEVSDIILSYVYNTFLYLKKVPDFDVSQLQQIFQLIDFSINKIENDDSINKFIYQARFNALKIISEGIKDEDYCNFFFEEYSNEGWLHFFVEMIHQKSSTLIEYGYSILKGLVSNRLLKEDVIRSSRVFDLKLISEHIDFDNDQHNTFVQKYDVCIVNECFQFLYELISNYPLFISDIIINYTEEEEENEIKDDIMIKIFMIVLHSVFEIREISSQLLCLILMIGSPNQITSLSLNYIIECLFCILEFDAQRSQIVIDCLFRVVNAFLNFGCKTDDLQILFEANNASEVFQNLIEDDEKLKDKIIILCNSIDFKMP